MFEKNYMSHGQVTSHLIVRLGNYLGRNLLLDQKQIMEHICDGYLASLGVDNLQHR